jgi:hypothetical protein
MAAVDRVHALDALRAIDQRFRPVTMADRQLLPVTDPLSPLLAGGGLRRGSTVAVDGPAATSLALALVAEASGHGSWVAVVGIPTLGLVAASELGVALDRLALVPHPAPGTWATVVAALVDAVDVVLVGPARVRPSDARRVSARARERGAVVVPVAAQWPDAPDVRLAATSSRWEGLGAGDGHLVARRVVVEAHGRRDAARRRSVEVWLPGPGGGVVPIGPARSSEPTRLRPVG